MSVLMRFIAFTNMSELLFITTELERRYTVESILGTDISLDISILDSPFKLPIVFVSIPVVNFTGWFSSTHEIESTKSYLQNTLHCVCNVLLNVILLSVESIVFTTTICDVKLHSVIKFLPKVISPSIDVIVFVCKSGIKTES